MHRLHPRQEGLDRELGRKDNWKTAIRRFRRWVERARDRWILEETQFRRAS